MKTATPFSNSFTLTINPGLNFSNSQTTFPQGKNPPAFIPQTPFCGREISRGKAKNPFPQKTDFRFAESILKPHALPEYLEGRTPKKNVLSIFKKKSTPAKSEMQGVFFLSGLLAYSPVRGAFFERTILVRATTRSARATSFVLKVGSNLVQ